MVDVILLFADRHFLLNQQFFINLAFSLLMSLPPNGFADIRAAHTISNGNFWGKGAVYQ